ncbi:MAG: hypothetical protein WC865_13775 [Bacteroidales bacterium]
MYLSVTENDRICLIKQSGLVSSGTYSISVAISLSLKTSLLTGPVRSITWRDPGLFLWEQEVKKKVNTIKLAKEK